MADETITLDRLKQEFGAQSGSHEESKIIAAWAMLRTICKVRRSLDGGQEEAGRCIAMRIATLYLAESHSENVVVNQNGQHEETRPDKGHGGCECVRPRIILNGSDPWCSGCNRWRTDLSCGCCTESATEAGDTTA